MQDAKQGGKAKRKSAKLRKVRQRSSERRMGSAKKKKGSAKKKRSAKKKKSGRISGSETSSEEGSLSDKPESVGAAAAEDEDRNDAF